MERKLVTVIFCDLVGSTTLAEGLDPETVRSVTLRYFSAMREQVDKSGGTVEKFIGDAVMAVFGVPLMHEDDALRAVGAAAGMLAAVSALNAELEPALGVVLRVRIGVHTGPAVTGTDASARQALVSGDTVNVAARLEQAAGPGEILIGPLTRAIAGSAVRVQAAGPLQLKGRQAAVAGYRLLGVDADAAQPGRRFDTPFVGRAAELSELDQLLDGVCETRRAALVTVYGEPGIGKTRLARAWRGRAARPATHGSGRCRSYGEHGSLAPLADAVRELLDASAGDRPGPAAAAALPVLEAGLLRDGTPSPSLAETSSALAQLLGALAAVRPVAVVIDDWQWASDPLLETVGWLARELPAAAVLIVCLARFDLLDRVPSWQDVPGATLTLAGLSAAESAQLAGGLAEVSPHAAAPARVIDLAAGNPFYLEQLLCALADDGAGQQLPPTLQALLGARIDALTAGEKAALSLAAVLGREFAADQLAALAAAAPEGEQGGPLASAALHSSTLDPGPPDPGPVSAGPVSAGSGYAGPQHAGGAGPDGPLPAAVRSLTRRRLVVPQAGRQTAAPRLRFASNLVHEVTYERMAKSTRADRHERAAGLLTGDVAVARHLESAHRLRAELGELDEHARQLGRQAARLLAGAGSRALDRSDLHQAAALLERAAALTAPGEPGRAGIARRLGEVRIASGAAAAGRELLRAVLGEADPAEAAHARLTLAVASSDPAAASPADVARGVLPVFEAARDELGQARARIRIAQDRQLNGRHGEADALLAAGLAHAMRAGAEPERALALGAIGISLWRGPEPAGRAIERCRALLAEHGGPRLTVRVTLNCPLAMLLALREEWDEARACLAEATELAGRLGYAEGSVVPLVFAAGVESLAGRREQARDLLDRAAVAADQLGAGPFTGLIRRDAARLLADTGLLPPAAAQLAASGPAAGTQPPRSAVAEAGPPARTRLPWSDAADVDGIAARLAAARGDAAQAAALAAQAVAAAARTDSPIVQATAALDQALVFELLGRLDEAVAAAEAARQCFEGKGHLPGERSAAQLRTRLAAALRAPAAGSPPEPRRRAQP